jgi:hypothetical protein
LGTRFLGRPRADANGGPISAHAPTCPLGARGRWVTQCVTPRQTCLQPNGFRRNLRSKTRWFTGFCNSHQVSHFATFFIDARAEISVAESRSVTRKIADANTARERAGTRALCSIFLGAFCAGVRCLTSRRTRRPEVPCASARKGKTGGEATGPRPPHRSPRV